MNIVSISAEAFLLDMFCAHYDELPLSILKHIAKIIDYNKIPENVIVMSDNVRSSLLWNRMSKMKLIRVLIRCLDMEIDILDDIKPQLSNFEYKVKDLIYLLKRRPRYIVHFPIDLNKLKTFEASSILSLGDDYFIDKIDMAKYTFNFKESMDIIQGYKYDRSIIEKVNYKSLKGYQISEIMSHSGSRDIDLLDISALSSIDWVNLLSVKPELLEHCDFDKFNSGDIFYSIELCCMFKDPDLTHLVMKRDLGSISPFGWEKLIISHPKVFVELCDLSILNNNNWKNIITERPELEHLKVTTL